MAELLEIPESVLKDKRNGYLIEFRMDDDLYERVAKMVQKRYQEMRVFTELDSGYMRIRVPSQVHQVLVGYIRSDLYKWANTSAPRDNPTLSWTWVLLVRYLIVFLPMC